MFLLSSIRDTPVYYVAALCTDEGHPFAEVH